MTMVRLTRCCGHPVFPVLAVLPNGVVRDRVETHQSRPPIPFDHTLLSASSINWKQ